jgi:hypothetical protein
LAVYPLLIASLKGIPISKRYTDKAC